MRAPGSRRRACVLWALVSVLPVAWGCGWKSDGLERLEDLYPTPAPAETPDAGEVDTVIDVGTPACSGLDGKWAVRLVEHGSMMNDSWDVNLYDLFMAKLNAEKTAMELAFCDQQVKIVDGFGQPLPYGDATLPEALKTALNQKPPALTLPGDGSVQASDVVWLWGLKDMADPLHDALPTKDDYATNPYQWDQDGDGKPGVTLQIKNPAGDRHMARRAVWTFRQGRPSTDNLWLVGALVHSVEQSALSASAANKTLEQMLMTPAPITSKTDGSVYQMRCVGETYDCAKLAVDHPALFKKAPQ
jgi:hypothetical protein